VIKRDYIEWAKRNGTEIDTARKDGKENALEKWQKMANESIANPNSSQLSLLFGLEIS